MCGLICHDRNKCPPCSKKSKQACLCGSSVQERNCDDLVWQCEKTCKKLYACGIHACQLKCHIGDCGDCPLGLPRECPCGKQVNLTDCYEFDNSKHSLLCTEPINSFPYSYHSFNLTFVLYRFRALGLE